MDRKLFFLQFSRYFINEYVKIGELIHPTVCDNLLLFPATSFNALSYESLAHFVAVLSAQAALVTPELHLGERGL